MLCPKCKQKMETIRDAVGVGIQARQRKCTNTVCRFESFSVEILDGVSQPKTRPKRLFRLLEGARCQESRRLKRELACSAS